MTTLTTPVTAPVSRANKYKVCSESWHHKRFMVCVVETVERQMTLKTKVNIFRFLKTFCSIESIYRYSLVHYFVCMIGWITFCRDSPVPNPPPPVPIGIYGPALVRQQIFLTTARVNISLYFINEQNTDNRYNGCCIRLTKLLLNSRPSQ